MAKDSSSKSLREDLRNRARKSGERQMDLLRINRKEYLKSLEENSAAAKEISRSYLSSAEQDGSTVAAYHKRRLDFLRGTPRPDSDPAPDDPRANDFPWPDGPMPGMPPDGRPFDWEPEFPRRPEGACHYERVVTLDTVVSHIHQSIANGVTTPGTFNDDLTAGENVCQPFVELTSLSSESLDDPTLMTLRSIFRFRFRPTNAGIHQFRPAAFVNGYAYTLEVSGIFAGQYIGPIWSTKVSLVTSAAQRFTGAFSSNQRTFLTLEPGGAQPSGNVVYDSTSGFGVPVSIQLAAGAPTIVAVELRVELSSINSFPSVRFDGADQYFKVPEVYVDKLVCRDPLGLSRDR